MISFVVELVLGKLRFPLEVSTIRYFKPIVLAFSFSVLGFDVPNKQIMYRINHKFITMCTSKVWYGLQMFWEG